jgi:hypothetical protein
MINVAPDYIEILKINPDYALIYNEYVGDRSRYYSEKSISNLIKNKHKGELSKKAVNRLHTALDWMLLIAKNKTADNLKNKGQFKFKVSMLTLTLPCEQLHDDLFIKKMMLNEFLTILRKKYNLQNYIWKAEKQGNGNIHFHLIIDKYIFYKDINNVWNQILDTHGYIEKYRKNQQKKHEKGFYYDKKKSKRWSKSAQLKAFKQGVKTNWRQPTGTTDIHSLKKIRNAKSYLSKYISKNPDVIKEVNKYSQMYCRVYDVQHVPADKLEEIKIEVKKKLSIVGNLWYVSRSLSELKGIIMEISDEIGKELNSFRAKALESVIEKDFCTIFKFSIKDIFKNNFTHLGEKVKEYILKMRSLFYPPGELIGSPLGLPLNIFN